MLKNFALPLLVLIATLGGACSQSSLAPSGLTTSESTTPPTAAGSSSVIFENPTQKLAANALTKGDTNVPLVAKSLCGFGPDNPYVCCQNSPGQFGNCTGGAWQKAKESGWGSLGAGLPGSWGNAGPSWVTQAQSQGYLVDSMPTPKAIGVARTGTHVFFVTDVSGTSFTTAEQNCGYLYPGGFLYLSRTTTAYAADYIRAPIPTVTVMLWSGATSSTNGALTVSRGLFGAPVTVSFGFSLLRSNVNKGTSTYLWTVAGAVVSTAGTFAKTFSTAGTFPVSVKVTNGMGVSTTVNATIVVR
jgi:surface antigen